MPPDEREWLPPPEPTSRLWDTFLAGEPSGMEGSGPGRGARDRDDVDQAIAETIRRFHALDDAPAPDAALVERIWQDALQRQAATARATANGRHAGADLRQTTTLAAGPAARSAGRWREAARRLTDTTIRQLGVGALAGAVAGFVAIGGGARLIMRLLAMTADPAVQGTLTENGERVGDISLGGTLALMLGGMMLGLAGGAIYALIRPWLPWSGWRRGLVFGLLLAMTFGAVMLDNGENPDYRRFGVPFLNVCLFNLLPIAFGLLVVPLAERLDRRFPSPPFAGSIWHRARGMATYVLLTLAALLTVLLVVPFAAFGASPIGLIVAVLVLTRVTLARWIGRFERPTDLLARPAAFATAYAVLLLPALTGLFFTLRAAGRILGGD
jgi:hypothetical protein